MVRGSRSNELSCLSMSNRKHSSCSSVRRVGRDIKTGQFRHAPSRSDSQPLDAMGPNRYYRGYSSGTRLEPAITAAQPRAAVVSSDSSPGSRTPVKTARQAASRAESP